MIKAVLFDMDGVIIDSEKMHSDAFSQVIRNHGVEPTFNKNGLVHLSGIRERDNWEYLKKKFDLHVDTNQLTSERLSICLEMFSNNLKPMNGLLDFINLLSKHHIKIAVASSSPFEQIKKVINTLHLETTIKILISGQLVTRGKPFPDIFLEAAKQLGVIPADCLVIEDAQTGIESGKNAGMKVVAIPSKYTLDHDFSKADIKLKSLKDISWKLILSL